MSSDDLHERDAPERAPSLPSDVTANVWADAPSQNPSSGVDAITGQFDGFDPFKPAAAPARVSVSSPLDAPPTPLKAGPPLPAKRVDQEEKRDDDDASASATDDVEKAEKDNSSSNASTKAAGNNPETPAKAKPAAPAAAPGAGPTSQSMTPTGSGSSLSRGLDTIASAFRRRSISTNPTPGPSSPRPATPFSSTTKPSMLVLDKDEMDEMDESEREAPPAMPTLTMSYSQSGSGNEAPQTDNPQEQQEQEDETPQFDFNLFLEQMRSRPADPIAKYLRSFLKEFAKRTWGVNDQIRVINDFLDFIAVKMRENEVWKHQTEKEFDNAVEAMEKLVMNRLHHQTFVPALIDAQKASTQTDDLERDHVLSQRIRLFGWVDERHLDLPKHEDNESFIDFAKQELRKVNSYKAPRDKLICILNCCKVIFGLMRHLASDDGADTFIPFLILVVLRSNPPHLISNVAYIQRFRNPERLAGENGYYLSSLTGAISFIETMDSSSLSNITQEEFEKKIEQEIQSLPPEQDDKPSSLPTPASPISRSKATAAPQSPVKRSESNRTLSAPSPRKAATAIPSSSSFGSLNHPPLQPLPADGGQRSVSPAEATRDFIIKSSDNLQKTVSKPLQALGRIFTEMGSDSELVAGVPGPQQALHQQSHPHHQHGRPVPVRSRSAASLASPTLGASQSRRRGYNPSYTPQQQQLPYMSPPPSLGHLHPGQPSREPSYSAGDFLADEVSAEEVQATADAQQRASKDAKIETLANIFPGIERETLDIVLSSNGEDVERSIEGLLEMA